MKSFMAQYSYYEKVMDSSATKTYTSNRDLYPMKVPFSKCYSDKKVQILQIVVCLWWKRAALNEAAFFLML